jgi:2-oxoglutarate dehydrogenase E2 component (dihydrolipoamide succinyltransferase)
MAVNIVVLRWASRSSMPGRAGSLKAAVAVGEPLVELETDKVDVEVNAPRNGVLRTIAHAEGADVKIGEVLGTMPRGLPPSTRRCGRRDEDQRGAVAATPSARKAARSRT